MKLLMSIFVLFSLYLGSVPGGSAVSFPEIPIAKDVVAGAKVPGETVRGATPLGRGGDDANNLPNTLPDVRTYNPNSTPKSTKPTSLERERDNCKSACIFAARGSVAVEASNAQGGGGSPTSCDKEEASGIIKMACNAVCVNPQAGARAAPSAIAKAAAACVAEKANAPSPDAYSPSAIAYSPSPDAYVP